MSEKDKVVERPRGRPEGAPVGSKQCPHGIKECLGPLRIHELLDIIIAALQQHESTRSYAFSASATARQVLAHLGTHPNAKDIGRDQSYPCPYHVPCTSPASALQKLYDLHKSIVRAEIAYFQATGEWLCAGEYSPTSALSAVYAALGQLEEAAFVLDAARFRYRIYRCGMFERLAEVPPEEILRAARED